ncbi:Kinase A inhibitor [Bacillus sp. THAF10]|uniref:5-oxoprolinase subunit PxpB n=1 Tax=Bacillus sp. THAF10 TaxID=2587848 RepID=UPI001267B57F|nr:5-oxoprolinase subunit PxpB [Bacillus sp. THAF10]QFT91095.1 Kinase A inhibitor [Bacillus sp. THAF10]
MNISFFPLGDTGIQLSFGDEIKKETNTQIRRFAEYLRKHPIKGVMEWVPAYTTLTIFYQPDAILYQQLHERLLEVKENIQDEPETHAAKVYEIPTLYGGEEGSDLGEVARYHGLTEEEVISIHSEKEYYIYMMGFVPGFPYLGGMDKQLATPRRENPRPNIPAGSVGIAGEQTGVYSLETPGGWQIIGQTPIKLYDPTEEEPILLKAGHYLQFVSIDKEEFQAIKEQIKNGSYSVKTREKGADEDE